MSTPRSRQARSTRPASAAVLRKPLHWTLATLVLASGVGMATPALAASEPTPPPVSAAAVAQNPLGLTGSQAGSQLTLQPVLTNVVGGLTTALGLSRTDVVFTSLSNPSQQWVYRVPAGTLGQLLQGVTFDVTDPARTLQVVSVPAGATGALPGGSFDIQMVARPLLGLLGDVVSDVLRLVLPTLSRPGMPGGVQVPAPSPTGTSVVEWLAPSNTGNLPITEYIVTAVDPAGNVLTTCRTTNALTCVLTGLTGQLGGVLVVAVNSLGNSLPALGQVIGGGTGGGTTTPPAVLAPPAAPASVSAVAENGRATVSWSRVTSTGLPVTGYLVRTTPGGPTAATLVNGADTTSTEITGLANGSAYTFTVTPVSTLIEGASSNPTVPVVPSTTPGAPVLQPASATPDAATLRWSAPADNGGAAVTGYRVTIGGRTVDTDATSVTVAGLAPATSYVASVQSRNVRGLSPAATQAVTTPAAPPLAATIAPMAKKSGKKTALVLVDLDRPATVVVRMVRGKISTSRTVALSDAPTNVPLPVTKKAKKLANGRFLTIEVRTLDGTLVSAVKGKVKGKARRR